MFTGLVETVGVLARRSQGAVARVRIEGALGELVLGESVNVNGVCLTVDSTVEGGFEADLSQETQETSTLGRLAPGSRVHLERAMRLESRFGGHIVLGHVDGIGKVKALSPAGSALRMEVEIPGELERFVAPKGSIALDGVSLTVNGTAPRSFDVMLVPHTLGRTTLGDKRAGSLLNVEIDVLARYVARQLETGGGRGKEHDSDAERDERILAKLRSGGFV